MKEEPPIAQTPLMPCSSFASQQDVAQGQRRWQHHHRQLEVGGKQKLHLGTHVHQASLPPSVPPGKRRVLPWQQKPLALGQAKPGCSLARHWCQGREKSPLCQTRPLSTFRGHTWMPGSCQELPQGPSLPTAPGLPELPVAFLHLSAQHEAHGTLPRCLPWPRAPAEAFVG